MTFQIKKSEVVPAGVSLPDAYLAFGSLVSRYISELTDWHEHNVKARAIEDTPEPKRPDWADYKESKTPQFDYQRDVKRWEAAMLERHRAYPKPVVLGSLMAAVATKVGSDGAITYAPDFEIIDDDPKPEELLPLQKQTLLERAHQLEYDALAAALPPPGKRRLLDIREHDILAADHDRVAAENAKRSQDISDRVAALIARHQKEVEAERDRASAENALVIEAAHKDYAGKLVDAQQRHNAETTKLSAAREKFMADWLDTSAKHWVADMAAWTALSEDEKKIQPSPQQREFPGYPEELERTIILETPAYVAPEQIMPATIAAPEMPVMQPATADELRPVADTEFLIERRRVKEAAEAIHRKFAQVYAEIEDLTVDTVMSYQLPSIG